VKYIINQEEHHHKKTFKEEYLEFLEKFGVEETNSEPLSGFRVVEFVVGFSYK